MSRHAQLPPRCPLQKKPMAPQANFSISSPSCKDIDFHPMQRGHYKSNSILEEQPAWLNDLLSDIDSISNDSCEPDDGLESSCMYGPNSPRRKNTLEFPEKEIVLAFSECVTPNPLQHLDGYSSVSGVLPSDFGDASPSAGEISNENKPMKRHPGQRSRARKLQYISELERTVDVLQLLASILPVCCFIYWFISIFMFFLQPFDPKFMVQNLGSELAVRVASLIQQHAALLLENNTLKQRLLRMKQEKFIVDGEYQSLKKEVDRLKIGLAISANNKVHTKPRSHSDAIWNMLDMRKLDLN
ncbi:hypothetical protein DH2020_030250 [Rehmannia glutinosa]|uniref:Uncharacterized protein n=1 Tax=Rehmannia glutinosa TaxID=99300 RepID=A0ABR0VMX1_REHGL